MQNRFSPKNEKELELYSSASSLSDMEIFIFPELMYALVLANIMSPVLWKWRKEKWFEGIEKKSLSYKINRIKQYVMDHYVFNLDLETWGLTTKEKELKRFSAFIDPAALAQSNALFGYEGDKYYYDVDIRRHFGLDKYNADIVPYWKTETVEAMDAFRFKEGYATGAGECVSLSALYVAALFVVGRVPLDNIFMIATPLHSQNFIAEKDGFITNNRRIVTKKMWYNGTELSAKARRSMANERITIVSHISGVVHTFYKEADMKPERFDHFKKSFCHYLEAEINFEYFANFLYSRECYWSCFQYRHIRNGRECYISLNCIFNTQRSSKNRFDNESRAALIEEMDSQCFSLSPIKDRILINEIEDYLNAHPNQSFESLTGFFSQMMQGQCCVDKQKMIQELGAFLKITPRLPDAAQKEFTSYPELNVTPDQDREQICGYLHRKAGEGHRLAILSLYAWRDMDSTDWQPFLKAAFERNPVCCQDAENLSVDQLVETIGGFPGQSIYEGNRLAQPDEVWNFRRGDGIEKAILLFNILKSRYPEAHGQLDIEGGEAVLKVRNAGKTEEAVWRFASEKQIGKSLSL
ncbi:MAG: hypothetical protein NC396_02860 [Bacteroides sp.]|nr:hypothetical protein [Bacteroides sp.]MCM1085228.1 hypothetical protein [Bacteroides sp.]